MKLGLCKVCGAIATQTCQVCGSQVCIKHIKNYGCDICHGGKKI